MTLCDYVFVSGNKKGTTCGTFIRKQNDQGKCARHHKCPLNKNKHACVDCKGSQICQHNRPKYQCSECCPMFVKK